MSALGSCRWLYARLPAAPLFQTPSSQQGWCHHLHKAVPKVEKHWFCSFFCYQLPMDHMYLPARNGALTAYIRLLFYVLWSGEGREGFAGLFWAPDGGDFPGPFRYGNSTAADSWKPDPWDKGGRTETAVSAPCSRLSVQRQVRASLTWHKAVGIKIAVLSHRQPLGLGGGKSYIEQPHCFLSHMRPTDMHFLRDWWHLEPFE